MVSREWLVGKMPRIHTLHLDGLLFKEPGLDFVRSSRMLRRTELKNIASIDDAKEESIQFPKASTAGQIYGSNYAAIIWI